MVTISDADFHDERPFAARVQSDPQAFIALYDLYFARVYNYTRYRCHDRATADDLTGLVFEQALAKLASYDPQRGPFGAWLFGIARNTVNNHLRSQQSRRWLHLDNLHNCPEQDPSPEELVARQEARYELAMAIQGLSEREQDLLGLKFAANLTNRRIAEITGLSESNVGVILYRTLRKLRLEITKG